jgi:two-component system response regulator FlrC
LAVFFLEKHARFNGETPKRLSGPAEIFLKGLSWPGNVRELENLMERATLLVESDVIALEDLQGMLGVQPEAETPPEEGGAVIPLKEMEKSMIFKALEDQGGNRTHAAEVLGISVRTLRNKLHEYRKEMEMQG